MSGKLTPRHPDEPEPRSWPTESADLDTVSEPHAQADATTRREELPRAPLASQHLDNLWQLEGRLAERANAVRTSTDEAGRLPGLRLPCSRAGQAVMAARALAARTARESVSTSYAP
jgi:hypothetical protein